jgi:hypothetical protein
MNRINLSNTEKRILKTLCETQYNKGMFGDLSREELLVASGRLKEYGLIKAHYAAEDGGMLAFAMISDEGRVYLKENPLLKNPVSDDELKRLQIDELKYKKKIRWQESVIRWQRIVEAILFFVALIGWLFYFLK